MIGPGKWRALDLGIFAFQHRVQAHWNFSTAFGGNEQHRDAR
jgi:hypothetical protein